MQLGIFAKTFACAYPHTVLVAARQAGLRTVHYKMACSGLAAMPEQIAPGLAEAILAASKATEVAVVGVSATYNMVHPDPEVGKKGQASLERIAAVARNIETPLLTLCTGTRDPDDQWRHHADNTSPEAWRDLLASLETAIGVADRYDVYFGIEPELANVIDTAHRARRLIDEMRIAQRKILFDPANLFEIAAQSCRRVIVAEAVALLSDRIAMAHAKDPNPQGAFVAAGIGVFDYESYLTTLRAVGFNGPLITHGLLATEAPEVARFLSGQLAALEKTL